MKGKVAEVAEQQMAALVTRLTAVVVFPCPLGRLQCGSPICLLRSVALLLLSLVRCCIWGCPAPLRSGVAWARKLRMVSHCSWHGQRSALWYFIRCPRRMSCVAHFRSGMFRKLHVIGTHRCRQRTRHRGNLPLPSLTACTLHSMACGSPAPRCRGGTGTNTWRPT